jgi:hypothetical protein
MKKPRIVASVLLMPALIVAHLLVAAVWLAPPATAHAAGTVSFTGASATPPASVFDLISQQHQQISALFDQLLATPAPAAAATDVGLDNTPATAVDSGKQQTFDQLQTMLTAHQRAEEILLYPLLLTDTDPAGTTPQAPGTSTDATATVGATIPANPAGLVPATAPTEAMNVAGFEAYAEHHGAYVLLWEAAKLPIDSPQWTAKIRTLQGTFTTHAGVEESTGFTLLRQVLGAQDTPALVGQFITQETQVQTQLQIDQQGVLFTAICHPVSAAVSGGSTSDCIVNANCTGPLEPSSTAGSGM